MIYLDSTTTVSLNGLQDVASGAYINNATVGVAVADLDGNTLITLSLASIDTSGDYAGNITPTMTQGLQAGESYTVEVTALLGSTVIDYRQEQHSAQWRGFYD